MWPLTITSTEVSGFIIIIIIIIIIEYSKSHDSLKVYLVSARKCRMRPKRRRTQNDIHVHVLLKIRACDKLEVRFPYFINSVHWSIFHYLILSVFHSNNALHPQKYDCTVYSVIELILFKFTNKKVLALHKICTFCADLCGCHKKYTCHFWSTSTSTFEVTKTALIT